MQTITIGSTATKPSDPTRDGYTFTGWYTDSACTSAYDFSTAVKGDITLYAGWKENETATAYDGSSSGTPVSKGTVLTDSSGNSTGYKVTSSDSSNPTVQYVGTSSDKKKKSVTIPATVTDASGNVYKVTEIAANVFKNDKKLTTLKVGKNVKKIGASALNGAVNLKKVTLNGNTTTSFGKNALKNAGTKASKLTIIVTAKNKKQYSKVVKAMKKAGAKKATYKFKKGK